jgi:hypothetical protein
VPVPQALLQLAIPADHALLDRCPIFLRQLVSALREAKLMILHRIGVLGLYNVPMGKFHTKDNVCAMGTCTIDNAGLAQLIVSQTSLRTPAIA